MQRLTYAEYLFYKYRIKVVMEELFPSRELSISYYDEYFYTYAEPTWGYPFVGFGARVSITGDIMENFLNEVRVWAEQWRRNGR